MWKSLPIKPSNPGEHLLLEVSQPAKYRAGQADSHEVPLPSSSHECAEKYCDIEVSGSGHLHPYMHGPSPSRHPTQVLPTLLLPLGLLVLNEAQVPIFSTRLEPSRNVQDSRGPVSPFNGCVRMSLQGLCRPNDPAFWSKSL